MSIQTDQTEGSDDETSTLDSGFDNENVLVETLQSRFYEALKVFYIKVTYLNTFLGNLQSSYTVDVYKYKTIESI